jgi:DNA-binding MarR family transcriptional regulator
VTRASVVGSSGRDETVDQASRLFIALARLGRSLRVGSENPIGPGAFSALWTITAQGPLRLSDLADAEAVTRPTMTRIVAWLEQNGLITRAPDPADGRAQLVAATRAGRTLIANGKAARVKALSERIARLDPEVADDLGELISLLESLAER